MKKYISLFITMFKIGLFTFGGGYAMIALLENEFVAKRKYLSSDEFMNLVAIAESTPGPIAINCSTYIGYKVGGFFGALLGTIGMCIPSFVIIYVISLFFNQFLEIEWVASAFKGIQVGIIFVILSASIMMLKNIKKSVFNITIVVLTVVLSVLFSIFAISFSAIFYILISGLLGLIIYLIGYINSKNSSKGDKSE
ncbi:MAG: chromate transporter [Clostridia bacterium]|nr:chromate transporter [Clostridia bacterium]